MTTEDQTPDFLKCIICHELFNDPTTLRCGHTFCANCVGERVTDDPDTDDIKPLQCPLCGQETKSPHSDQSSEEETGQIRTSLFISRLTKEYASGDKGEDVCGLCEDDGKTKEAAVWCSECGYALCTDCQKIHKKLNTSHTTTNVDEKEVRTIRPKCGKHKDSTIDLICEDCEEAVCQRCCILEHRNCRKITPLEDSTRRIDSLLGQYVKQLKNDLPGIASHVSLCKKQTNKVNTNIDNAETDIDETCDELVAEIREQQKELKEKLDRIREEEINHLSEEIKSGEMRLGDARQRIGLAEEARNSASAIDHFEIFKIFTTIRSSGRHSKTKDIGEKGAEVSFISNQNTLLSALQKRRIGYLKGLSHKNETQEDNKKKIDTGSTGLYGITVLTFEGTKVIVVTNPELKLVQSFYTYQDQEQNCSVKLDSQVYGITQLEATKAAITVPKRKQILVFRVGPKLEKDSIIKTQLRYVAVTCLSPTTLAVSGEESGFIDVIDLSGTRLRSFGADIFSKHLFLCTTLESHILVSDVQFNRVVCVNDEGEPQFEYDPQDTMILSSPRGISQGIRGDIVVVDKAHHKVIQLDQTGQFVRHFLTFADEISDPSCIHVDSDNVVYVSVDGRYIHVHEMKDD